MVDWPFGGLPVEQQLALRRSINELEDRFGGVFGPETIQRVLSDSYESLLPTAKTTLYLPNIAERFARERLHAIGRVDGSLVTATPAVLFLCVQNAGRSQMAAGWLRHLAGNGVVVWSGGSEPTSEINPAVIAAMSEVGIDISAEFPKPWNDDIIRAADVVITMGCGDACPVYPGRRYEDWILDDPAGMDLEAVRPIRHEVQARVERLISQLGIDPIPRLRSL
jgi:arsenate reductase